MRSLVATIVGIFGAGALLFFLIWLRDRFALCLTLRISDDLTEVLDGDGNHIVTVPTSVHYIEAEGGHQVVGFGSDFLSPSDFPSPSSPVELRLSEPPEEAPEALHEAWAAFLTYCCQKARTQLGLGAFRPLRVNVIATTSSPDVNAKFVAEADQIVGVR